MPELPEVETVRRGLAPHMEGRRLVRVAQRRADLRFPFPDRFVERLEGARVIHLGRRAKFMIWELDTGEALIVHLGMSGRVSVRGERLGQHVHETGTLAQHDHVVFSLEDGTEIVFNDPRRFGFMELWPAKAMDTYPRFKNLGPEPLTNWFHAGWLDAVLAGRNTPIKAALLDQSVVAGLGNIYVCEALFRARISPRRLARTVPGARAARLAPAIDAVIAAAIEAGGSSLKDFAHADGSLGYFQHGFSVYDREDMPCSACTTPVRRIVQSGRSTFYCPACQR